MYILSNFKIKQTFIHFLTKRVNVPTDFSMLLNLAHWAMKKHPQLIK